MKKRNIALLLAMVLVFGVAVGGTIAWLTDKTDEIVNTFTTGNVDIDLTETTGPNYKMVPNALIAKDPTVTVKVGSEACWVFVKVEETEDFEDYIAYSVDSKWTALGSSYPGVYYLEQADLTDDDAEDAVYNVLSENLVAVQDLTNEQMDAVEANPPQLTFTAYAIQKAGFDTPQAAWLEAEANATKYAP